MSSEAAGWRRGDGGSACVLRLLLRARLLFHVRLSMLCWGSQSPKHAHQNHRPLRHLLLAAGCCFLAPRAALVTPKKSREHERIPTTPRAGVSAEIGRKGCNCVSVSHCKFRVRSDVIIGSSIERCHSQCQRQRSRSSQPAHHEGRRGQGLRDHRRRLGDRPRTGRQM